MVKDPNEKTDDPLKSIEDLKGNSAENDEISEEVSSTENLGSSIQEKLNAKRTIQEEHLEETTETEATKAETLDKVTSVAKNASRLVSTTISALSNPITWVIGGATLLTVLALAGMQTIGKSDFARNCSQTGDITIASELSEDEEERANQVATYLTSNKIEGLGGKPMTKEQAAGVIGNMSQESGVSTTSVQSISTTNPDYYKECDNECVLSWGSVSGKAVGLIQWDGSRRIKLVDFAKSKGTAWHDANTQLEFLIEEANGSHKSAYQKAFMNCTSVKSCVADFSRDVEVAGVPHLEKRISFAEGFIKKFKSSTISAGSGSVASCSGDSSGMDMSSLAEFAVSIAYPWEEYNKSYVTSDTYGKNIATKAYKEAKALAEKNGGKDPMGDLFASCDRFVATILKATKADVDVPWGSTTEQYAYFSKSPKWEKVSCKDRKPGDVIITTTNGHVMMYVGNINGKDSLSSASYLSRVGATGPMEGCVGDAFNADSWTNTQGFRLKK